MHTGNLVIIELEDGITVADLDLEAAVARAMGPDEEGGGFWDWYQIGGRWTGTFDGYDPDTDPANIKTCDLCDGTGKRTDMEVQNGCNGCTGKGEASVWPTQYKRHPGDVMPMENLTEDHLEKFYRVVCSYGVFPEERYTPWAEEKFPKLERPPLAWLKETFAGCIAVVVDSHN